MGKDDFEDRELCPDELCTGIIGEDGRCGVCGRRGTGVPAGGGAPATRVVEGSAEDEGPEAAAEEPGGPGGTFDEEERVPCEDELCTGIIGEDGRCGVCGRSPEEVKRRRVGEG